MDKDKRSGYRTLRLSVLLSAPGPLVLGLGLMVGHSSTQISDFTRRTAELMGSCSSGRETLSLEYRHGYTVQNHLLIYV